MDFSEDFVHKMKNRMETSGHKYGSWAKNRPHVDCFANAEARIKIYRETGNTEGLIDAANFLMMEYMLPLHPKAHFRPMNSEESPAIKCFKEDIGTKKRKKKIMSLYSVFMERMPADMPENTKRQLWEDFQLFGSCYAILEKDGKYRRTRCEKVNAVILEKGETLMQVAL